MYLNWPSTQEPQEPNEVATDQPKTPMNETDTTARIASLARDEVVLLKGALSFAMRFGLNDVPLGCETCVY